MRRYQGLPPAVVGDQKDVRGWLRKDYEWVEEEGRKGENERESEREGAREREDELRLEVVGQDGYPSTTHKL